ncbi:enoyl-CoA hydratase/isomerase family protein [Sphingopyxis terrae]|uniref:enoyl-CoA hydratase/isomerase family protein n=1 Tax=Sphingopyxis terrae TaxID=33052 RepID=UPI002A0C6EEE|nr:enoyl-CoA hydratase-related protein [Sphingopyxis terrae]MDX8356485.1 enoyl-CoA hydratase-related protein [Sphingopyxis terrae]
MTHDTPPTLPEDFSSHVMLERPADHVALIRFARLDKKNALHSSMVIELGRILKELNTDDAVRCVVITGGETCFAAGADIKEMVAFGPAAVANAPERIAAWEAIERFEKPLIAAVNGIAFGAGCELALLCDFIVAGSTARFGQPEIKIGGMPGDGGSQRLPRKLPPNVAAYHLLTGEPIEAQRALQFGLVQELCDPADTIDRAIALASTIARQAPSAVRAIKACIAMAVGATPENGLAFERATITALTQGEDSKEGMRAFVEKREPIFSGH